MMHLEFGASVAFAAERRFLEGDASFRRYETLNLGSDAAILMDMPARPDGPPVKNGLPYSAIAHLAEDIRAVVAINSQLIAAGYSAPRIEAVDLGQGLAVMEDLGRNVYGRMMQNGEDMREPMAEAIRQENIKVLLPSANEDVEL